MPTDRPTAYLQSAISLAARLGCPLVALCSGWACPHDAADRARRAGIDLIAVDITRLPVGLVPRFETTDLLAGTRFERKTDTSLKRNLGLLLARLTGWQRIVFLDDDITVPEPGDLGRAVSLLGSYAGVGLSNGGFPDNSVVCHAYRVAGGPQDTFIGGGALAVGTDSTTSFFPNIYNDDWFFLVDDNDLRRSAITGLAVQLPYDPFANAQRARHEEFGDCLAEGVFWLLDQGRPVQDADTAFWRFFLDRRLRFINEVIGRVDSMRKEHYEKKRIISALKAARGRSQLISPALCVKYLRAWRADRVRWRRSVEEVPTEASPGVEPTDALFALGVARCGEYVAGGVSLSSANVLTRT